MIATVPAPVNPTATRCWNCGKRLTARRAASAHCSAACERRTETTAFQALQDAADERWARLEGQA